MLCRTSAGSSCLASTAHRPSQSSSSAPFPCTRPSLALLPGRRRSFNTYLNSGASAPGAWSCRLQRVRRSALPTSSQQDTGSAEPVEPEVLAPKRAPISPGSENEAVVVGGERAGLSAAWAPALLRLGKRFAPWTALFGVGGAFFGALAGTECCAVHQPRQEFGCRPAPGWAL